MDMLILLLNFLSTYIYAQLTSSCIKIIINDAENTDSRKINCYRTCNLYGISLTKECLANRQTYKITV